MSNNKTRSQGGEKQFKAQLKELGAELAPGAEYKNSRSKVKLVCRKGHLCEVLAGSVLRGQGICNPCAGRDPAATEAAFLKALKDQDATLVPGEKYHSRKTKVAVYCAAGHRRDVTPDSILRGRRVCGICSGVDSAAAAAAFWETIHELGAKPRPGAKYKNAHTPVPLYCRAGHECDPQPRNVAREQGICTECARTAPAGAEARFWDRLDELDAQRLPESVYVDSDTRVPVLCRAGHLCRVLPRNVNSGGGICRQCRTTYDRVYLLAHPDAAAVKVGIASGAVRVRSHVRAGYRLVAEWTGLEHDQAVAVERDVLTWWRFQEWDLALEAPEDGRTETTADTHLPATLERLAAAVGAPVAVAV